MLRKMIELMRASKDKDDMFTEEDPIDANDAAVVSSSCMHPTMKQMLLFPVQTGGKTSQGVGLDTLWILETTIY